MKRLQCAREVCFCLALLGLSGALDAKTKNDFDPDAPYPSFKTFSLVAGIDLAKTGLFDDPEKRMRVANFVSGILELRGLREVPRDEKHDLAVRVWIALRDRQSVSTISYGSSYWGGYDPFWTGAWGYWYEETVVRNYVEGTLIIDLLNPGDKQLVWRTYLKRDYDDRAKAYEQTKKELNKAFAKYPPSADDREKQRRDRARQAQ
jgi:hypothetical protein